MKPFLPLALLALAPFAGAHEGHDHDHDHAAEANPRVALNAVRRANLGIAVEPVGLATIRKTVFALGVVETDPAGRSAASVRIPGRVLELKVALGDTVKKGDTLAVVESRTPGAEKVPVTAFADGTVDDVPTQVGEPVTPDAPLLRCSDHTRLFAVARVPQSAAAHLVPGKTRALVTPDGGKETSLVLDSLTPVADEMTGTVSARFRLPNPDARPLAGLRVAFRLILDEKTLPVTVPRDAVQGENGDLFVFIEEKPGIYEKHPVVLGEGDDRRVAVTGPEAGEKVVVKGAYSLRYADAGNISLREAMDIAHGHKHGPNGEEPGETPGKPHTHTHDDHDHHDGDDHDHDHHDEAVGAKPGAAKAGDSPPAAGKKPAGGNSALVEAMNAAHGHQHGPNGEEPGENAGPGPNTPGFFTGDSGAIFCGTLASGEALLLALAVNTLRRRKTGTDTDA